MSIFYHIVLTDILDFNMVAHSYQNPWLRHVNCGFEDKH